LIQAEEAFQQLQELFAYVGSDVTALAAQLFKEEIEQDESITAPTQEMIDKTQDAMDAVTAGHQIYEAASNVAVLQADRLSDLRRMI
jgi:hypothetical protein